MPILDDFDKIKKLDKNGVLGSIELLYSQIRQVLEESRLIKVPREYSKVKNVVINGMGASNLGADIFKAVFSDKIKVPVNIVPGYEIPAYVSENTLYIISSYSGNTEEPLSVYSEVKKRGAKIMAITSGNSSHLEKIIMKDNVPGYIFKADKNPSGVPRMGLGYSVFGMAVMLAKTGLFAIDVKEIEQIITDLELWDHELRPQIKTRNNTAKKLAEKLHNRQIVVVGAEFLQGNLRTLRNQICETGKTFAGYLTLPELNHYAMEGLGNPGSNKKNLAFFFIDSSLYHPRVQKRSELTKEVVKKNGIKYVECRLKGRSKLEQAFELLQLGSWVTFYLAMLNNENPAKNPWVDWFKERLK